MKIYITSSGSCYTLISSQTIGHLQYNIHGPRPYIYIPCISHIYLIRDARGTINSFNDHCCVVLCPRKIEYKPEENFSGLISPEGTMNIGWLIGKLRKREECGSWLYGSGVGMMLDVGGTDILKFEWANFSRHSQLTRVWWIPFIERVQYSKAAYLPAI